MSDEPNTKKPLEPADSAEAASRFGEDFGRELGARTVLFHQAVAERLGIGATDHKCLDIAQRAARTQPVTAGQLAELTGLTTGAITGVLDRLEKAGFIRREKHPHDRRQVIVRILDDRLHEFEEIFAPMGQAWAELCKRYSSEQLATIRDFTASSARLLQQETERLRARPPSSPAAAARHATDSTILASAPLGLVEAGQLEFPRGAVQLHIGSCDDELLYRARFERNPTRISVEGGHVTVVQRHGLMSFLASEANEMLLSERIPWSVRLRGASKIDADLRRLQLSAFEIVAGVSEATVRLPPPAGTIPISIRGGASKLRMLVPAGVSFRFLGKGGASQLTLDRLQLGAVGGEVRWESPDFASASNRYDFDFRGGASELSIVAD